MFVVALTAGERTGPETQELVTRSGVGSPGWAKPLLLVGIVVLCVGALLAVAESTAAT